MIYHHWKCKNRMEFLWEKYMCAYHWYMRLFFFSCSRARNSNESLSTSCVIIKAGHFSLHALLKRINYSFAVWKLFFHLKFPSQVFSYLFSLFQKCFVNGTGLELLCEHVFLEIYYFIFHCFRISYSLLFFCVYLRCKFLKTINFLTKKVAICVTHMLQWISLGWCSNILRSIGRSVGTTNKGRVWREGIAYSSWSWRSSTSNTVWFGIAIYTLYSIYQTSYCFAKTILIKNHSSKNHTSRQIFRIWDKGYSKFLFLIILME